MSVNVASVLAHVQATQRREVVDTVADGLLLDSSLEEVAKLAVSNEVPASLRHAAVRRFLREADVGEDYWQQRRSCAERLIDDAIHSAENKDDGALPSCQFLLAKSRSSRDLIRKATLQRLKRGNLSEHERCSAIKVVSRLLRSEGGEVLATAGIELALSCVEMNSDSPLSFEAAARWLMPAICATGLAGECAASTCAIRHAYLMIASDESEHSHRRQLALGALVAGRSILLASSTDDWAESVICAVRLALVADVQCKTSRRYALRLLGLARPTDADWQLWLSAYAIAEFETSVHLFAHALNALDRFLKNYHGTVPLEWTLALASRVQTNENPSVRKTNILKLLKCSPSLFPWKFVRDTLLPALDDTEIRKGRDLARQIDASAETFFAAYIATVTRDTLSQICRFVCSRYLICARGRIGAVGRDILLAAVRAYISSEEYKATYLQVINLTNEEISIASDGIVDMMQSANRSTTQKVVQAVAAVVCTSSGIAHNPAAVFANLARNVDLIPPWLATLGGPSEWAQYCSLTTSSVDAAGAVVAALATGNVCERWQAVARAFVEAKGVDAYVLFVASKCEDKHARSRLWRALHVDEIRTLDSMTLDQLRGEEYFSAAELREHMSRLTAENIGHPVSVAWQDCSFDLMKTTRALLESDEDLTEASYLRSLRCLQSCIIATAPILDASWRRSLYKLAADVSAHAARSSTRWSAIEHERWMLMAQLVESAPDMEVDVDIVEITGALERCNSRVVDVVALLRCAFTVLARHPKCNIADDESLSILVASAETAARDTNRFGSPKIVRALTQFIFAPACAIAVAYPYPKLTHAILSLANGLFQLADARRPHITRALSTSFAAMCQMNASRCDPMEGDLSAFVPILMRFLLDREPELRRCDMPDADNEEAGKGVLGEHSHVPISRARLSALILLEDEGATCPSRLKRAACLELLHMDAIFQQTNKVAAARKGSEQWGRRLRAWQAICVLAPQLDTNDKEVRDLVMLSFPAALISPCLPCIRYAIETACVSFACRWPSHALPRIFSRLDHVRDAVDGTEAGVGGRELALASLLVVAGHVIVDYNDSTASGATYLNKDRQSVLEARKFAPRLLRAALALQGSTRGLVRGIAQLLIFALCPQDQIPKDLAPDDAAYIASTIAALKSDPDVVRHVNRQRRFFWELRSPRLCTVQGILETGTANDGDVSAESIVTEFKKRIAETAREIESEDYVHGFGQNLWRPGVPRWSHQFKSDDVDEVKAKRTEKTQNFVQRKIDQLLDEETSESEWLCEGSKIHSRGAISSMVTATGYERMRVIVCASLVDKAPNLAGLTRTAEVFAAEAVVVPDIRVLKAIAFQAVSVTAEKWIPVEECQPRHLASWLHKKRQEGYAIVALEQATGSVALTNAVLPTPAVLLLGHEKEGLEIDLLHSVDMCVEVPQLGIVRSLNVHVSGLIQRTSRENFFVSGALALWQWRRQSLQNCAKRKSAEKPFNPRL